MATMHAAANHAHTQELVLEHALATTAKARAYTRRFYTSAPTMAFVVSRLYAWWGRALTGKSTTIATSTTITIILVHLLQSDGGALSVLRGRAWPHVAQARAAAPQPQHVCTRAAGACARARGAAERFL